MKSLFGHVFRFVFINPLLDTVVPIVHDTKKEPLSNPNTEGFQIYRAFPDRQISKNILHPINIFEERSLLLRKNRRQGMQ